jgi:hypothetical protein
LNFNDHLFPGRLIIDNADSSSDISSYDANEKIIKEISFEGISISTCSSFCVIFDSSTCLARQLTPNRIKTQDVVRVLISQFDKKAKRELEAFLTRKRFGSGLASVHPTVLQFSQSSNKKCD